MTNEDDRKGRIAQTAFEQALTALSQNQAATAAASNSDLRDGAIERLIAAFEAAAQMDETSVKFWTARSLQVLLEYTDYRNLLKTLAKAKTACERTGQKVSDHFVDVTDMVSIGSGAEREINDIRLSRYACYLTAMNGDSRKRPIAFAQTYFAIQTRRQEIEDDQNSFDTQYAPLKEDQKRLLLRDEIKDHNKKLASAAKDCGVIEPFDFAVFQTHGYKGLYGGLDVPAIRRVKGLKATKNILDHMGSTELAANLFRATQTEEKLRREKPKSKTAANHTHYEVGRQVRKAIKDIGGTMPERLEPADDLVKIGRRSNRALANSGKPESFDP